MLGWCADSFRFLWSLLYWNTRKSLFRLRGAVGTAPCQNPSDSGLAARTSCDACLHWHTKTRFKAVCPLLTFDADNNALCSVNANAVRPFWLRAFAYVGVGALCLYLVGTVSVFTLLRTRGYEITYVGVAWPPEWRRFHVVQARLFYEKGRAAFAEGRTSEAVLSLAHAYERDPQLYEAGGLLAWLWQASQPVSANRIYLQLIRDHPQRRAETAQRWHRALLSRGDFESIGRLSTEMLSQDSPHLAAWTYALLFADRHSPSTTPSLLDQTLQRVSTIPPEAAAVLRQAGELKEKSPELARKRLLRVSGAQEGPASAILEYHRINSLIRLGFPREALEQLDRSSVLDARANTTLRLDAHAVANNRLERQRIITTVLGSRPTLASIELLAAHLIRYPEASLIETLFSQLESTPLAEVPDNYSGFAALFCLAALHADSPRCDHFSGILRRISGASLTFLSGLEAFLRGETSDRRMGTFLPRLQPLSLEVIYALHDRPIAAKVTPSGLKP